MTRKFWLVALGVVFAVLALLGSSRSFAQGQERSRPTNYQLLDVHLGYNDEAERAVVVSVFELDEHRRRVRYLMRPTVTTMGGEQSKKLLVRLPAERRCEVAAVDAETGRVIIQRFWSRRGDVFNVTMPAASKPTKAQQLAELQKKYDELYVANEAMKTAYGNQGIELRALQDRNDGLSSAVDSLYKERNALAHELYELKLQRQVGDVTGFGLRGGVNYMSSYEPRATAPFDLPVYVDFYNDSLYQTRVGMVQVLFTGGPVSQRTIPFTVSLVKKDEPTDYWGNSTIEMTSWDSIRGGWVATLYVNEYIEATGHSKAGIRFDSRAFDLSGPDKQVSVSIINTWSYDGLSIMTGPDHGSGTVVVTYQ